MKVLIIILLASFSSFGQMNASEFDLAVGHHSWHPSERGLLLFSGVHTIKIQEYQLSDVSDENYHLELRGINEDESKFTLEGQCAVRFENKYFEIALSEGFTSMPKYICGFVIDNQYMKVAVSDEPFILTDKGLINVLWYLGRD